jgi:hypothetical protein
MQASSLAASIPSAACAFIDSFLGQGSISAAWPWADGSRLFGKECVVHLPEFSLFPGAMLGPSGGQGVLVEGKGISRIIETRLAGLDVFVENLRIGCSV